MTRLSGCQAEILGAMAGRGWTTAAEIAEGQRMRSEAEGRSMGMSELGDEVRRALTDSWRTTIEIADGIPVGGRKDRKAHREMVRKHLRNLEKYGLAERSDAGGLVMWRRKR